MLCKANELCALFIGWFFFHRVKYLNRDKKKFFGLNWRKTHFFSIPFSTSSLFFVLCSCDDRKVYHFSSMNFWQILTYGYLDMEVCAWKMMVRVQDEKKKYF